MVIATAVLFCGRAVAGALVAPPPETLRAYDRPSDDGSVVAVEWGRSPSEGPGVYYVVEIAPDVEGKPGQFKRALTVPSTTALKSDQPKFFGFSKKNREVHYVGIEPARYFPPDPAKVRAQVRAEESKRLKPEQLTDPNVQAYLGEKAERRLKREIRRVNGLRYHFRVAIRSGGQLVYIARDGRLAIQPVSVVRNEGGNTYVSKGLQPGDSVITTRLVDPEPRTLLQIVTETAGADS